MTQQGQAKQPDEMYCSNCGSLIKQGVQFCHQCGTATGNAPSPAPSTASAQATPAGDQCPICKREVMSERRFCHWCNQFLLEGERPLRAAGFGRRLGAWILDALLWFGVLVVGGIIDAAAGSAPALTLIGLLGWFIFVMVLWAQGQSPGKAILGMRVVDVTGVQANFWRMALREIIGKFVSGLVIYLGYLWILWDKDQQGWHDKIANTVVVAER